MGVRRALGKAFRLGGKSGLGGWGHWDPRQPRDMLGRFTSTGRTAGNANPAKKATGGGKIPPGSDQGGARFGTGRVGVRIGTRSGTVSASKSVSLGKVRVVGGVYGRVERTQLTRVEIEAQRRAERAALRAASRIQNQTARGVATSLVENRGQANVSGANINLRSGSNTVRKTFRQGKSTTNGVRAPRRKPRTRGSNTTGVRVR